jgi:transposase
MRSHNSNDLRARVVSDIAEVATLAETADHHHVCLSSVVRFLRLKRTTGNIRPTKFGGYKPYSLAAHEKLVRRLVAQQPDITLAEIRAQLTNQKIKAGQSSILRFLRYLKLTFKKSLHSAEQDRPDVAAERSALRRRQPRLDPKSSCSSMKPAS